MLISNWDWDIAKKVWQREAHEEGVKEGVIVGEKRGEARGARRANKKWKSIVAKKDAEIAALKEQNKKSASTAKPAQ